MNTTSVINTKLEMLSAISKTLNTKLQVEKYGFVSKHSSGVIRWLQMDRQTCALLFDFVPQLDISFTLKSRIQESFFHSLILKNGNVVFSGFSKKGNLNLMPNECLFFHSDKENLSVTITKGKECKLILLSHCETERGKLSSKITNSNYFNLGVCNLEACNLLGNIWSNSHSPSSFMTLKGLLFSLLGATMPDYYKDSSDKTLSRDKPNVKHKFKIKPRNQRKKNDGQIISG